MIIDNVLNINLNIFWWNYYYYYYFEALEEKRWKNDFVFIPLHLFTLILLLVIV